MAELLKYFFHNYGSYKPGFQSINLFMTLSIQIQKPEWESVNPHEVLQWTKSSLCHLSPKSLTLHHFIIASLKSHSLADCNHNMLTYTDTVRCTEHTICHLIVIFLVHIFTDYKCLPAACWFIAALMSVVAQRWAHLANVRMRWWQPQQLWSLFGLLHGEITTETDT